MPRLPVSDEAAGAAETQRKAKFARRRSVFRLALSALIVGLAVWLVAVALSPTTGGVASALLLVMAALLPLHLFFFQWNGIRILDRLKSWPRQLRAAVAIVALASSPMVLYPLGLLAIAVSLFAGGAATPALAVTGLLMLSPIIAILVIALMFVLSGYKGG